MWKRAKGDLQVPATEWLSEWNVPPAERHSTRPFCSVHWAEGADRMLLPGDKVFRRETQSKHEKTLVYLLQRDGKVVAVSEQVLWKMIE